MSTIKVYGNHKFEDVYSPKHTPKLKGNKLTLNNMLRVSKIKNIDGPHKKHVSPIRHICVSENQKKISHILQNSFKPVK